MFVQFLLCVLPLEQDCQSTCTVFYHPNHTTHFNKYTLVGTIRFFLILVLTMGKKKGKKATWGIFY